MKTNTSAGLLTALTDPLSTLGLRAVDWDVLIRLARRANVLARLAADLQEARLLAQVPEAPRNHLESALTLAARQREALLQEIRHVAAALATEKLPLILLKGAAYLALDLPVSHGRLFGDIDLLVPHSRLRNAESALMLHGWHSGGVNAYDDRYYREWMHEIPPMTHMKRQSVLDVHHNILPLTAHTPPDPALLLAGSIEAPGFSGVRVLAPADMVLHSACHLFHEGELHNGLRDLSDLDRLLRYFGAGPGFWEKLRTRAEQLGLAWPLAHAVRLCVALLQTPVPAELQQELGRVVTPGRGRALDALYHRALMPMHPLADDAWTPLARWLLYVRAHWLRMPPHLLAAHLARKAWYRWTGLDENPQPAVETPPER